MKITARDLQSIFLNSEPNKHMRSAIGSSLCRVLYDSASNEYEDEYKSLGDAGFYNMPSDDDISLCFEYMEENEMMDNDMELNL